MEGVVNLSLRQLETFREVFRTGSISEAARGLGRTQPAVSAVIAKLETELGFALFERRRGRLEARPEAHYFLEETEQVLERLARSRHTMREIAGLRRGNLRIACLPAASGVLMPRQVAAFLRDKPDVSVSLMMRSSAVIEEWIASQQYDIGLAETPAPRNAFHRRMFDLEAVCALPAGDPLAAAPVVTPALCAGRPAATLVDEHPATRDTVAAFAEAGVPLDRRFELQTFAPGLELVRQGLCFCVCDPLTALGDRLARPGGPGLVLRPFAPRIPFSVSILTPAHRPMSRLTEAFARDLGKTLATVMDRIWQGPSA
jgi:DNA-binding transcriptional LysR family regulator